MTLYMKWLKKINQLFTHKELRDDYEEEYVEESIVEPQQPPLEEAAVPEPKKPVLTVTETPKEVTDKNKKKIEIKGGAFRFPLIPDDEVDDFFEAPLPQPEKREERVQQQKEQHQDPSNIVLEPEPNAPGIRELLAQRKRGNRQRTQLFTPPPADVKEQEPLAKTKPVSPVEPFAEPRRFVPSSVPSPVFGYGERTDLTKKPDAKEPSTINELLDKHRYEMTAGNHAQEPQQQPLTKPQIDVMNKSILQTVESAYEELLPTRIERSTKPEEQPEDLMQEDILEQDVIQMPALPLAANVRESVKMPAEASEHPQALAEENEQPEALVEESEQLEALEEVSEQSEALEEASEQSEALEEASEHPEALEEASEHPQALVEENEQPEALEEASEHPQALVEENEQSEALEEASEHPEALVEENEQSEALVEASEHPEALVEENEQPEALEEASEQSEALVEENEQSEALVEESEQSEALVEENEQPEALEEASEQSEALEEKSEQLQHVDEHTFVMPSAAFTHEMVTAQKDEAIATETKQHVEHIDVQQQQAEIVAKAEEVVQVATRKERARPFNVVMLKSDKKKLEEKKKLQAVLQQQPLKTMLPTFIEKEALQKSAIKVRPVQTASVPFEGEVVEEERLDEVVRESQVEVLVTEQQVYTTNDAEKTFIKKEAVASGNIIAMPTAENTQVQLQLDVEEAETVDIEPNPVRPYIAPSEAYLVPPEQNLQDTEWMQQQGECLVEALSHFQVKANIESIVQGPAVTQFEITVEQGTKVSKVRNLSDDLKLALAAKDIRIQAPIPGKNTIGIEIPNRLSRAVRLSEVTMSEAFTASSSPLEAALGLDLTGAPVTLDLRKMPHGLIAGATGSGKSVCINSILVSLLYKAAPHELKLLLIDPKMVELAPFNHIPHLVSPVITDVKAATAALKWAVDEMERRYQLFAHMGVRDLERYNKFADKNEQPGHKLPYILIVIDELADLMMMAPHDVEEAICRIAQKARACGIHLIVATQRPSVDVITGLIKSNIPTRIAFMVSSQIDSRTILDTVGAERLLGRGDMLYLGNGQSAAVRLQGTFVTDDEIEDVIAHVRAQGKPEYIFKQEELLKKTELVEKTDELFEEVCRFVYERKSASTSAIQRYYSIGYSRAARLVDMLEAHGFVSEPKTGNKPRDVYITEEELENMFS